MSEEYKNLVQTVDLDNVVRFYAEQFRVWDESKAELLGVDHYVDVGKGKVVFVLRMKEKKE